MASQVQWQCCSVCFSPPPPSSAWALVAAIMWLFVAAAGEHVHSSSASFPIRQLGDYFLASGVMCRCFPPLVITFLHEPSAVHLALCLDYHFTGIIFMAMAQFVGFIAAATRAKPLATSTTSTSESLSQPAERQLSITEQWKGPRQRGKKVPHKDPFVELVSSLIIKSTARFLVACWPIVAVVAVKVINSQLCLSWVAAFLVFYAASFSLALILATSSRNQAKKDLLLLFLFPFSSTGTLLPQCDYFTVFC